ncbi:MAG: YgjV family protein [Clostridia bacterium]|nr:YgjV family protein [Clostridia bacterium]
MRIIAFLAGILAVTFFLLGYLQKKRKFILFFNLASRLLYIIQYVLLGAFAGAVLDVAGAISTFFAQNVDRPQFKKYKPLVFIINNIVLIGIGILLYKNVFSIFLIIGVTLQTDALWLKKEKYIRIISLICCPFCFTYNISSGAIGSCIGDVLAFVSLGYSYIMYDIVPSFRKNIDSSKGKVNSTEM